MKAIRPKLHFWLHQVGALCLLVGLFLMMSGNVDAATIGPVFPVFEGAILRGAVLWLFNLVRRA